jgi:hypothetical protein
LTVGPIGADLSALPFRLAEESDDSDLRRLLRINPIGGDIALSLEREPSFFLSTGIEGPKHLTIVATRNGRIVAIGSISERDRFLNGVPSRVGYLGGLRLDASCRGHASILRRGYEVFRLLHEQGGPRIYLTSIVADNIAARRILERGLPGMPIYRPLEAFITVVLRVRRDHRIHAAFSATRSRTDRHAVTLGPGRPEFIGDIVSLLNESNRRYQFAPCWRASDLLSPDRCPGLRPEDFRLAWQGPRLIGCAALWDQRALKQTVVRRYSSRIDRWRRLARILPGVPKLPEPGAVLAHGYVSHIATAGDHDRVLALLLESMHSMGRSFGLEYLSLGFASRDPRLAMIRRRFGGRLYRSNLYAVHWPEDRDAVEALDGRVSAPEVAVL